MSETKETPPRSIAKTIFIGLGSLLAFAILVNIIASLLSGNNNGPHHHRHMLPPVSDTTQTPTPPKQ